MGILDAPGYDLRKYRPATIPAGLGWDESSYPLTITLADMGPNGRSVGSIGTTAEALFDAASTARTSPSVTYYVNVTTGSDSNNGLSSGAAVKSIWKAVALANAGGVAAKVNVAPGTYFRTNNPWYNGGSGITPTVDIAFVATSGRVVTGTFDPPGTPSLDGTHTKCYSYAVASVNRVCDMTNLNEFGQYSELRQVSTAAEANAIPGSWALVAGTIYIRRQDDRAVVNTNTRVYRPGTSCWSLRSGSGSVYIGGSTPFSGFDCEGSSAQGVLDALMTSMSTAEVLAVNNCTFRYPGGATDNAARAVSVDSWRGLAVFTNCDASAAMSDGWNFHNTYSASAPHTLTVNCTGTDNGRYSVQSCNGWTGHEDVISIDVAGHYKAGHGGTVRSIGTSKALLVGTLAEDDRGDIGHFGTVGPTGFRVDDTATFWCDRTKVLGPPGSAAYVAADGGATIHKRNAVPTPLADNAIGTIDTY